MCILQKCLQKRNCTAPNQSWIYEANRDSSKNKFQLFTTLQLFYWAKPVQSSPGHNIHHVWQRNHGAAWYLTGYFLVVTVTSVVGTTRFKTVVIHQYSGIQTDLCFLHWILNAHKNFMRQLFNLQGLQQANIHAVLHLEVPKNNHLFSSASFSHWVNHPLTQWNQFRSKMFSILSSSQS